MVIATGVSPSFLRIADSLLAQVKAFGQFCSQLGCDESWLDDSLIERFAFAHSYFQLLEKATELQMDSDELPLLYNTAEWPKGGPLGGYPESQCRVRPSHMLSSYFGAWNFQWECKKGSKSWLRRPLKAALWLCHNKGFAPVIPYLLDLHASGINLDPTDIFACLDILTRAYRAVDSDAEIVPLFFAGEVPSTDQEWINYEFSFEESSPITADKLPVKREDVENVLLLFLNVGLSQIEKLRNSKSYDEWLINQWTINNSLKIIQNIIRKYVQKQSLSLKSVYDHFEEIRSDSGGLVTLILAKLLPNELMMPNHLIELVRDMIESRSPSDWKIRVMQERAMVPYVLEEHYLGKSTMSLPQEWRMVSPNLAPIFLNVVLRKDSYTPWRTKTFSFKEMSDSSITQEVFDNRGIQDQLAQKVIILKASNSLKELRLKSDTNQLLTELGQVLNRDVKLEKIEEDDEIEMNKQAIEQWLESNKEAIDGVIEELDLRLRANEVMAICEEAILSKRQHNLTEAIISLENLLDKYPWCDFVHYEIGIAYDENGQPHRALPHIETAIAIRPTDPLRWHSLGVVLNNLNDPEGARMALAVKFMLETRLQQQPRE